MARWIQLNAQLVGLNSARFRAVGLVMLALALSSTSGQARANVYEGMVTYTWILYLFMLAGPSLIISLFLCLFGAFKNKLVYALYLFFALMSAAYFLVFSCSEIHDREWFPLIVLASLASLAVVVSIPSAQYLDSRIKLRIKRRSESATLEQIVARTRSQRF